MSSLLKKGFSAALVGVSLASASLSAQAISMTLPTTNINADSTFAFSTDSYDMMSALGIGVSGLGNATKLAGAGWSFDMPVTEVSVDLGLFKLSPVAGEAMGSALGFTRKNADGFVLANFGLDFKRNVLQADFTTTSGTTKAIDVFNFQVAQDLKISMDGGLSLNMSLDNMMLTSGAQSRFASALKLESFAVAAMGMMDFGSIKVNIDPSLRFDVSGKAFTASVVPEAPQVLMMMLGLVGLATVSHRRRRN